MNKSFNVLFMGSPMAHSWRQSSCSPDTMQLLYTFRTWLRLSSSMASCSAYPSVPAMI